jgi:HAD superfamily hydrolase (TIGR01509 family)
MGSSRWRERKKTTNLYITLSESRIGLFPGAREALSALSAQHRLALVTNGEAHKQRRKIERFDLGPFFERVFIEQEVGVGKPDPAVYRHILSEMRATPKDCCMVGDNLERRRTTESFVASGWSLAEDFFLEQDREWIGQASFTTLARQDCDEMCGWSS